MKSPEEKTGPSPADSDTKRLKMHIMYQDRKAQHARIGEGVADAAPPLKR